MTDHGAEAAELAPRVEAARWAVELAASPAQRALARRRYTTLRRRMLKHRYIAIGVMDADVAREVAHRCFAFIATYHAVWGVEPPAFELLSGIIPMPVDDLKQLYVESTEK